VTSATSDRSGSTILLSTDHENCRFLFHFRKFFGRWIYATLSGIALRAIWYRDVGGDLLEHELRVKRRMIERERGEPTEVAMKGLDIRAAERISGPSWEHIRSLFGCIHKILVDTDECVSGSLTTIYVKYGLSDRRAPPFAVVWIKKSTELIVGLALPSEFQCQELSEPFPGYIYSGLTRYIKFNTNSVLPDEFATWVNLAFHNTYRERI
jgi:hypothetical protein